MKKIPEYIKKSPELRTGIFILSVILSGILCSAFVTEITVDGKLVWSNFYKTTTFYLICVYCFIFSLYNRFLYNHEKNIERFADNNYCEAYIKSECLPELVEKWKKEIREGNASSELIDISAELAKIIKK
jgi:hypothetical protein